MKKASCLTILIIALFTAACRQPKDLVYGGIRNFKVEGGGVAGANLSVDIDLYNPNSYNLRLKKADVDVFINDSHLGKLTVDGRYTIAKSDTFILPALLHVDLKNALPNILQLVFNSDVDVKLSGTIKAGRHGLYINVPINYEGKQDILQGIK